MRLSPLKHPSSSTAAVGPSRAALAPARAVLSASAAALKSFATPLTSGSARNGVVAQATASMNGNGGSAPARRRRRIAFALPFLLSSRGDAALSPLRALPTAATSPSERQRSPKVTTTSSAVPAPPSLQRRASSSSSSATLLNSAPLPAPPADGAPLAHEIIKGAMVSAMLAFLRERIKRVAKRRVVQTFNREPRLKSTVLLVPLAHFRPPPLLSPSLSLPEKTHNSSATSPRARASPRPSSSSTASSAPAATWPDLPTGCSKGSRTGRPCWSISGATAAAPGAGRRMILRRKTAWLPLPQTCSLSYSTSGSSPRC